MKIETIKIGSDKAGWQYEATISFPEPAETAKFFGPDWLTKFATRASRIIFRADILPEIAEMHKGKVAPEKISARIAELWKGFDWPNREPLAQGGSRIKVMKLDAKAGQTIKLTPELITQLESQGFKIQLNA